MVEWTYFGQDRLAVGCLYKQPTGVVQEAGGCLFFQPSQATSSCAGSGLRKVRINRPLRSPISFYGYLAPLSRRLYQPENRFSSVSRPLLNVSGAASPLFARTRIPLTTAIGLRRLELRLDYAGEGGELRGAEWEIEKGGNGGDGGYVIAQAEKNWPADERRCPQIRATSSHQTGELFFPTATSKSGLELAHRIRHWSGV